jgi:hypothetical protein
MRPLRLPRRLACALAVASLIVSALPHSVVAQPNYATPLYFTTLAGSALAGSADGIGSAATFNSPHDVSVDSLGNVWVADTLSGLVRKITPAGVVSTLTVTIALVGPPQTNPVSVGPIRGIAVPSSNEFILSGYTDHTVRRYTLGNLAPFIIGGLPGASGAVNGTSTLARLNLPAGVAVDTAGNVYVADSGNHGIRKIASGNIVSTVAGLLGTSGSADGTGETARFNTPWGLAFDHAGNLYVADSNNHTIRRISTSGTVSTLAGAAGQSGTLDAVGTLARFNSPRGIAYHGGYVYVTMLASGTIRKIDVEGTGLGTVTTVAGTPTSSNSVDGFGAAAHFRAPIGIAADANGNLYVAESNSNKIRRSVSPPGPAFIYPSFSAQVAPGASLTLNVDVITDYPVTLQWRKDGVPIAGATADTYVIASAQAAHAGSYSVLATNVAGTAANEPTVVTVLAPPVIVTHPTSRTVTIGSATTFTVTVTPSVGPTFSWRKNGVAIAGATNATYSDPDVTLSDAGQYSVQVTHAGVSVTSNPATLTAQEPLSLIAPSSQTVNAGANVTFTATFTPPTAAIQWHKEGTIIPGATSATLLLTNVNATRAGIYEVAATLGSLTAYASTSLIVNVPPTITTQPTSQTVTLGQNAQFTVAVTPATGATYQWRRNGAAITGATGATLALTNVTTADAGTYSVVVTRNGLSVTSNNAMLTVNVPVAGQPVTNTVFVGAPVQFNFTSNPTPGTTFQWRKDGVPIAGATNSAFFIPSATLGDAGNYTLVFTLAGVVQTSNTATLIVLPLNAPTITTQPASRSALVGTTVQFNVEAFSPAALTFQWRKNGTSIPAATNEVLTISNAQAADAGAYSVIVSNAGGSTISNEATLTVNQPVGTAPSITSHPASQTVNAGAAVSLNVVATGTAPLSFQWYRNGAAITGATTSMFSISNAQGTDAAAYTVVISNSAGATTSNVANVAVNAPPSIVTPPAGRVAIVGSAVQLTVVANGSGPLAFQWRKDGVPISGATAATLSLEAVQPSDAGSYSVVVSNTAGAATSVAAQVTIAPPPPASRIANVSIRTSLPANETVIVGIAVEGGSRDILVRAVGPGLATFAVNGVMADPQLDLFNGQSLILTNEDWPANLAPSFVSLGAFGLVVGSRDAAFRQSLNGSFSIQARGAGAGVVLVEAYDAGEATASRLINVSARNRVGTGDDILIAGVTLTGTGTKQLLIRAVGPGLTGFGVPGALSDPRVEVFNSAGVRLVENDNWAAGIAPTFANVGAFALTAGSRDAALLTTLPAGSYTVQVRGADDGTGEALVEIYEVP